jgi:hypothetical protein
LEPDVSVTTGKARRVCDKEVGAASLKSAGIDRLLAVHSFTTPRTASRLTPSQSTASRTGHDEALVSPRASLNPNNEFKSAIAACSVKKENRPGRSPGGLEIGLHSGSDELIAGASVLPSAADPA